VISGTYIDAAAYGLSTADTGVGNATAMTLAIAAAVSAGKPLRVPAGTFNIDCYDTQNTGAVAINGSVAIFGAGQDRTIFKMVNYDQELGGAMFHIAPGNGTAVCFNDLTLQGPSTASLTLDSAVCWAVWCGGGGSLRMTRVDACGFIQEVKCSPEYPTYPGKGTKATYENCCFESRGAAILHIEGTDPLADSCDLVGTVFQPMQGVPVIPPDNTNGQWHNIYINRGVSLGVRGCLGSS